MLGRATIGVAALTAAVAIVAVAVAVFSLGKASRLERALDDLRVRPSGSPAVDAFDPARVAEIGAASSVTVFSGSGLGTGFAFGAGDDGGSIVVTNFHVVAKGRALPFRTVQVHVGDERLPAHPYRWDADLDIALLEVEAEMPILESAYFGDVPPTVGDPVLAFGSPEGLQDTATVGIISAIRSTWLQTDAQINHGNSGGPLLDRDGRVLGITSLGVGRGSGLGFAIDIRQVCELDATLSCEPSA